MYSHLRAYRHAGLVGRVGALHRTSSQSYTDGSLPSFCISVPPGTLFGPDKRSFAEELLV